MTSRRGFLGRFAAWLGVAAIAKELPAAEQKPREYRKSFTLLKYGRSATWRDAHAPIGVTLADVQTGERATFGAFAFIAGEQLRVGQFVQIQSDGKAYASRSHLSAFGHVALSQR